MDDGRFNRWLRLVEFVVGTVALGLISTTLNHQIQSREVEIKEQEAVGRFLEQAVKEDVGVRRRFALYFASVTRSDALRARWQQYASLVEREYQATLDESRALLDKVNREQLQPEQERALRARIAALEQALKPGADRAADKGDPHLVIHTAAGARHAEAERLAAFLQSHSLPVARIERSAGPAPARAELRYYKLDEKDEALALCALAADGGVALRARYVPGREGAEDAAPRHFELWLASKPPPARPAAPPAATQPTNAKG